MTLRVELDRLTKLGDTLQGLADEAAGMRTGSSADLSMFSPGGAEPAVVEAASIARDLVDSVLVAAVKERLSETGEIMVNVANDYREADEATVSEGTVATIYTHATGEWDVPEARQP